MLVCRLNDAILLRREMVKQRWNPMGIISPGSPGMYEEQYFKTLGKLSEYSISNVPWYNPKAKLTQILLYHVAPGARTAADYTGQLDLTGTDANGAYLAQQYNQRNCRMPSCQHRLCLLLQHPVR